MNSQEAKRAALYLRVSTEDQHAETQGHDLQRYITQRGWRAVEPYSDAGVSGAAPSRPALDRLMADARRRKFDVVVVAAFDRFARSTSHLLAALDEFRALGIEFVSLRESIDTSTPLGRMVFTIVAAVGELERAIIRERVHAGLRRARAQGKRIGRPPLHVSLENVLVLRRQGKTLRQIGRTFGVSRTKICGMLKAAGPIVSENPGAKQAG